MTDQAQKIAEAERVSGYVFQNKNLIWEAIQAPGRLNERLALVGDAGIRLFFHSQSYGRGFSKGRASIRHDGIANNPRLAEVGNDLKFPSFINKNISHAGGISENAMAATVEAVIGAAFVDGGFEALQTVIVNLGLE